MTQEDYEFILLDRIAKIKAINELYDLENNSYIAFSGGKDSVIVSHLIDLAIPDNKIPRVFANTGIEFNDIVKYVKELSKNDSRIIILNQNRNIKLTLKKYGYPFKSKEHSQKVSAFNTYKKEGYSVEVNRYLGITECEKRYQCPDILRYQFTEKGKYNYSKQCCYKLKKDLQHKWQKDNNKKIVITGMRNEEGGTRTRLSCLSSNNTKFHPLIICSEEWENDFLENNNIKICKLYYPPYNFKRTGCKGCPYNKEIQKDLEKIYKLNPNEYYQIIKLWKPVYDEYIRIGYRLKYYPHEQGVQISIYDLLDQE